MMAQRQAHQYDIEPTGKAGFEALLNARNLAAKNDVGPSEDWNRRRREEWLQHLEVLYSQVKTALEPYIAANQVSTEFRPHTLVEQSIGEYTVQEMLIKFVDTEIALVPVGTMVLAAKGRLDVIGPFGKTPLILVNSTARYLADVSQFTLSMGGKVAASNQQSSELISWEWRVVAKSIDRELISLNDEVILGLFAEVANG